MSKFNPDQILRGDLPTELTRLSKRIDDTERSKNLRAASIGSGGIDVKGGGSINVHDSGNISVDDAGSVRVLGSGDIETMYSDGTTVGTVVGNFGPAGTYEAQSHGFAVRRNEDQNRTVVFIGKQPAGYGAVVGDANSVAGFIAATVDQGVYFNFVDGAALHLNGVGSVSGTANMILGGDGVVRTVASSLKYKQDVEEYEVDLSKVLRMIPRTWRDKGEVAYNAETTTRYVGFIAEELHELGLTEYVIYKDGEPDSLAYDRISAALVKLAQDQESRISDLEERLSRIEGMLS